MGTQIVTSFSPAFNAPIDDRSVVATISARNAIDSAKRYLGMQVFVLADSKVYTLKASILNADWIEVGAGGGSSVAPTVQRFVGSTGSTVSGTYTTPVGVKYLELIFSAAGGGGAGAVGPSFVTAPGGDASDSSFDTIVLGGGKGGGNLGQGGLGGTITNLGSLIEIHSTDGNRGHTGLVINTTSVAQVLGLGGMGGSNPIGQGGEPGDPTAGVSYRGYPGKFGGGGGGASAPSTGNAAAGQIYNNSGGGGGAGSYANGFLYTPAATYNYSLGIAGAIGSNGTNDGGLGGVALLIIKEYY